MKIKYLLLYFVIFSVIAFRMTTEVFHKITLPGKKEKVIYLTTMGNISKGKAAIAKSEIERFYAIDVQYIGHNSLPKSAYCKTRERYVAVEILRQLQKLQIDGSANYDHKILALTDKDIETENEKHWGVMGLAFLGGDACVVSTFRLGGNAERFRKVTLHETGHMLGIDHCKFNISDCLMNDAKGKGATVDKAKIFICAGCRNKLKF